MVTHTSLVHTVPVYAPVRPGSLQPADRAVPGRIVKKIECIHTFPAVVQTRPGLGQKVITYIPSTFPVQPRRRYNVSRCVRIRHGTVPGISGRTPVLHYGESRKQDVKSPGVTRQHININKIPVELITDNYVICKVQTSSYIPRQKRAKQQLEWERRQVMAYATKLYLPIPFQSHKEIMDNNTHNLH